MATRDLIVDLLGANSAHWLLTEGLGALTNEIGEPLIGKLVVQQVFQPGREVDRVIPAGRVCDRVFQPGSGQYKVEN